MNKCDILAEWGYEKSTVFDRPDFDDAIIGVSHDGGVVYNYDAMVQSLVDRDHMTREEAVEFIDYNTIRAIPYAPDPKPIVVYMLPDE